MGELHFIYNPVAGNGISEKAFARIQEMMDARGISYTVARSDYAGHAPILAREAVLAGKECIVAVGGDGTVHEVAQELVGIGIPLGILPCGTGNDTVRALGIPSDPDAALEVLLCAAPRAMDVGEANGKLFINVAGFGFDVDVLMNTERYKKRFRGLTAYTLGLLHALFHLRLRRVRVTVGDTVYEKNALVVVAGNGTHFGGGMNVTPLADPFDGLLDICIISDVKKATVLRVLAKFVKGKHLSLPIVTYFKAKEITVESDPPTRMQYDGEIIGDTPVTFRVLPGKLLVLTGKQEYYPGIEI